MIKEVILNNKEAFDHWLNGGKVYAANKKEQPLNWVPIEPSWNAYDILYIIDDEYRHLRKALAEGKVVQYNPLTATHDRWDDIPTGNKLSPTRSDSIRNYRIKPDKPKFKVGDWVENITCTSPRIIKQVVNAPEGHDTVTVGNVDVGINVLLITDIKLWKPQPGEWVIMTEVNGKAGTYISGFEVWMWNEEDTYDCEPFLGELPSFIKEKL